MLRMAFLMLLLLLAPAGGWGEESRPEWLSENTAALLGEQYPGWDIRIGTPLFEDSSGALCILGKEGRNIAVIAERMNEEVRVTGENDAIIPDGALSADDWIVMDKWRDGKPYIWFMPDEGEGFYCELAKGDTGAWEITSGHFQAAQADGGAVLAFAPANQGTALSVSGEAAANKIYIPLNADLTFDGFDPSSMRVLCTNALTRINQPNLIPSTGASDALPQGEVIAFSKGKTYPVYSGPGKDYLRLGENNNAAVSTNDWIQVFGREGDWLLIQYNISDRVNRFGYITADALPRGVEVPTLHFEPKEGQLVPLSYVTDDPLRCFREYMLDANTPCVKLATMGSELCYVELMTASGDRLRGFTHAEAVDLKESHQGYALVRPEGAWMYGDAALSVPIGFFYGGVEGKVLRSGENASLLRIGGELAWQEGWIVNSELAMGALRTAEYPAVPQVAVLPREGDVETMAYTSADADARRILLCGDDIYDVLGDVGDFYLIYTDRLVANNVAFVPMDWVMPMEWNIIFNSEALMTLKADTPVIVNPTINARPILTLYQGVSLNMISDEGYYLTWDYNRIPGGGGIPSVGYLPQTAAEPAATMQKLRVGMLTPSGGEDGRPLYVSLSGSEDRYYGWGVRMLLMGETDTKYWVRLFGEAVYGYFNKEDVTLLEEWVAQDDTEALHYGTATLKQQSGLFQAPYISHAEIGRYEPGESVTLLSCLGAWWCVAKDYDVGFIPADRLNGLPQSVPAYQGDYNILRDDPDRLHFLYAPFWHSTGDEAWTLLKQNELPMLRRYVKEDGQWQARDQITSLLGQGTRLITGAEMSGVPLCLTLEYYMTGSDVQRHAGFVREGEDWRLTGLRVSCDQYEELWGMQTLYDERFTVDAMGTLTWQDQTVPLPQALLKLSTFEAQAAADLCDKLLREAGMEVRP